MFLLQLRHELWKLFGKKRTYLGFGMFILAQAVILLVFRFSRASRGMGDVLQNNGYDVASFLSPLTAAAFTNLWLAYLLLPLYGSLVGGDLVAKEAEDGTLRMILARPVSRVRLLTLKWVAGVLFSAVLTAAMAVTGLALGLLFFRWGGLFVFVPGELFGVFPAMEGLGRYAAAHALMAVKAVTITGLAFGFGCLPIKPAAATILALSFIFLNFILMNIPWFADLKPWFLTYHLNLWQQVYVQPVPWPRIGESLSLLAGFNATFFALGAVAFGLRDLKS
ncbi:MAG: ABC transporter permease subunit [Verrucomicrobiales bacterium]|nr:ABC transporter permease subunit [Verrucomicrobiales bacterium]